MKTRIFLLFIFATLFSGPAFAGVSVHENVGPGATSWPGTPILFTVTNPSTASVGESFSGGGGNTDLSETFTILTGSNYVLSTIDLDASGGSGTFTGTNVTLNLYDLGSQSAPNPSPYSVGQNLLGSGSGLSITYISQGVGILEFDFSGSDQVTLTNGHMYAFELSGVNNTMPIFWQRGTTDTYSGGAAYRSRSWINGSSARDFAMAVYGTALTGTPGPTLTNQTVVDWNNVHQTIDGFGGGVVFLDAGLDPMTSANMNTLYGTNSGQLGLSLLRVRIDPTTNWSAALSDGQLAAQHGAGILATPWTPPAIMKSNNEATNGGSLLPLQYATYASYLRNFWNYMSANGAPLKAISIQNEPDFLATYESCLWNSNQFLAFFQTNLGAFTGMTIMMPESFQYDHTLSDPTLNNAATVTNMNLVGGHLYGNGNAGVTIQDYANAHNKGKPTWMTEFLVNDQTIGTAITTAQQISDCLTVGNMSAYIWWKCIGDANGLISAAGVAQKRGYVMAQFSRFVRPGNIRIDASASLATVTAYRDTNSGTFAIVAINTNASSSINETFILTNFTSTSIVTPWMTTAALSLAPQNAVAVTNSSFTYAIPAQSIVTFAGAATNFAPTLTPILNQTVNAGVIVTVTNVASDVYAPPQTLTFNLLNAPAGASLNTSNGVFSWRPPVSFANSTNLIKAQVINNGTPALSATNNFSVIVNPLTRPTVSSSTALSGNITMVVNGTQGPDFTVLTSTNLTSWQTAFTTNSPALPWTFTYTNSASIPDLFFRIELGP